jgi:hypothetical protein
VPIEHRDHRLHLPVPAGAAAGQDVIFTIGAMHRAGVPIVAGTDGSGIELIRELEI